MKSKIHTLRSRIQAGVVPAMATPLKGGGYEVNHEALVDLVNFLIDAGVQGLFVSGTTGEGILLEPVERRKLHERAVAAIDGRVPALIHVGANTTAASAALAEHAASLSADAVVAVTPYFYPVHDDGLLVHYQAIAEAAPETPLLAYDIPHMAVNGIGPELLARLASEIPTFAGLKSSHQDAQNVRRLVDAAPSDVFVLAGNERVAMGLLALGVDGLISGVATAVPEPFVSLIQAMAEGNLAAARRQQQTINLILDMIPAGSRIGAIKAILAQRGIAAGPPVPPRPLPPAQWQAWTQIRAILAPED